MSKKKARKVGNNKRSQDWRRTKEYRKWRIEVIRRDKVCQVCGSRKSRQAHHVKNASHHPDLIFLSDNGITLCRKCHTSLHCDYFGGFRKKTDERGLRRFLKITLLRS